MKDNQVQRPIPAPSADDDMLRGIRALRNSGMIAADTPDFPLSVPDTISDDIRQHLSNHPRLSEQIDEMRGQ